MEGKVTTRKQVDACGEIVDGWAVEGTRTFSANGQTTRGPYTTVFATQFGGMPILEMIDEQSPESRLVVTFSLGQVTPDPATSQSR